MSKYEQEYIGNVVYRNLSVVDNLELYFKEQVFNSKRPSGNVNAMKDNIIVCNH